LSVTAYVRARKVGGSLVVTIPMEVVEIARIREGETLKIEIEKPKKQLFWSSNGNKKNKSRRKDGSS
jgi:antitoxin component of MazEF toxin-antitoxin module